MDIDLRMSPTLHPVIADRYPDEHRFRSAVEATYTAFVELHNTKERIYNDTKLSEVGRKEAIRKHTDSKRSEIESRIELLVTGYDKQLSQIDGKLNAKIESDDPLAGEIRSHFKTLPNRTSELRGAINSGDMQTSSAALSAPAYLSGLTDLEQTELLRLFHETNEPKLVEEYQYYTKLQNDAARIHGVLPVEFKKAGGS